MNLSQSQGGDHEARGRRGQRTKEWECQMCTLLNTYKRKTCAACLSERAASPDLLSQAVPSTQPKKRIRLRRLSQVNVNDSDRWSNDDDDLDSRPLKPKKVHRPSSQPTKAATDVDEEMDAMEKTPDARREDTIPRMGFMDDGRESGHHQDAADNKENATTIDESASLERMRAKVTKIHVQASKPPPVDEARPARKRRSLPGPPLLFKRQPSASSGAIQPKESSDSSSQAINPDPKERLTSFQADADVTLSRLATVPGSTSLTPNNQDMGVSSNTAHCAPHVPTSPSLLPNPQPHHEEPSTIRKPRGSFFYHVSQDTDQLKSRRLKRRVPAVKSTASPHSAGRAGNLHENGHTAIDIINAKWLQSNFTKRSTIPPNEAPSATLASARPLPPQTFEATDSSDERPPSTSTDPPPPQPFKQEVSLFNQINVDQEVEAPSFQLLSFSALMPASTSVVESAIPGPSTPPTTLPDADAAPTFNLLSGYIPNSTSSTPTTDVPQPGGHDSFHERDRGLAADHTQRRDSIYSAGSQDADCFPTTAPSTAPQTNRPHHHSADLLASQSSNNSDIALRQAGLDDSSEEEEFKPRKQLRTSRLSVLSNSPTEWTCKWCTYVNEDSSHNECECCGQIMGSSIALPTHGNTRSTPSQPKQSVINMAKDASSDASEPDGSDAEVPSWMCKMCTYENFTNPTRCELCDTPKGSNMPSQSEIQEFNHFDGDDDDFEFQISEANNGNVVDLTAASDGPRRAAYDDDSIEEISDTERAPPPSSHLAQELREFTNFTPVSSLRTQRDSIDYMSMFGANRGGKCYSDRLQNRIAESRRRKKAEARGPPQGKPANGKRKKGAKKSRKSTGSSQRDRPASRSFPQFQKASAAVKRGAHQPAFQFRSDNNARDGPRLLNANLQPKARTKSMRVVGDEGDFGAFRSARHHSAFAPVESSGMATWEEHGSMRFEDD